MARLRSLLFPALILGLLALAAFGVRQVIVGRAEPGPPSAELAQQALATAGATSEDAIEEFVQSGGDPCSLPLGRLTVDTFSFLTDPEDLDTLIDTSDLIVLGTPLGNALEPPTGNGRARILTTVLVDETLVGAISEPQITLDSGQSILRGLNELKRVDSTEAGLCTNSSQVVLFLNSTETENVFAVGRQGWARTNNDAVESAPGNDIFAGYSTPTALLSYLRQQSPSR